MAPILESLNFNPFIIKEAPKLKPRTIFASVTKITINYKKFTLRHVKVTIYIQKNKFSSHKQNLFGLIFRKSQRRFTQTKVKYTRFLLFLKQNVSQTFKCSNCK